LIFKFKKFYFRKNRKHIFREKVHMTVVFPLDNALEAEETETVAILGEVVLLDSGTGAMEVECREHTRTSTSYSARKHNQIGAVSTRLVEHHGSDVLQGLTSVSAKNVAQVVGSTVLELAQP
jgi:hypothetical protein